MKIDPKAIRIIRYLEAEGSFTRLDNEQYYFTPQTKEGLTAGNLRIIADYLDFQNDMKGIIEAIPALLTAWQNLQKEKSDIENKKDD